MIPRSVLHLGRMPKAYIRNIPSYNSRAKTSLRSARLSPGKIGSTPRSVVTEALHPTVASSMHAVHRSTTATLISLPTFLTPAAYWRAVAAFRAVLPGSSQWSNPHSSIGGGVISSILILPWAWTLGCLMRRRKFSSNTCKGTCCPVVSLKEISFAPKKMVCVS
jgi:hypothetical protein